MESAQFENVLEQRETTSKTKNSGCTGTALLPSNLSTMGAWILNAPVHLQKDILAVLASMSLKHNDSFV